MANRNLQRLSLLSQAFLQACQHEIKSSAIATARMEALRKEEDQDKALRLYAELEEIARKQGRDSDAYFKKSIAINDVMIGIVFKVIDLEFIRKKLTPSEFQSDRDENIFRILGAENHAKLCEYQPE